MKKTKLISPLLLGLGLTSLPSGLISLVSCGSTQGIRYIPESALKISGGVLSGFNSNIDVSKYDALKVPDDIRVISKNAFTGMFTAAQGEGTANNKVKTIILPSSIKYIEDGAFEDCNGVDTLDLTSLSDNDVKNLKIANRTYSNSNVTETKGTAFQGWKGKGTIKYNSDVKTESKEALIEQTDDLKAWNKPEEKDPTLENVEKHILSINDLHGAAPGFGDDYFNKNSGTNAGLIRISQDMAPTLNKYPGSFIVSAGDTNAGESFSVCKQADTLYPVLKAMGVRYSAVGNHGWDYGLDKLTNKHFDKLARTSQTNGNWFLASNILQADSGLPPEEYEWTYSKEEDYTLWNNLRVKWADPYKIVDMDGHKICLIGLTTHDTTTDGNKAALTTTRFMKKEKYLTAVGFSKRLCKEELGDEEFAKIETFILLTHCDSAPYLDNPTTIDPEGEAAYMATNASTETNSQIDGIISAHSHKAVAGPIVNTETQKKIWIGQAEQSGRKWLDTTITFDDTKPVGQRFKSIHMEVKTPEIPVKYDEKEKKDKPYLPDATIQLQNIISTTRYPNVKNVINEYNKQKIIAKQELGVPVGQVSSKGLEYWFYENGRQLGTKWYQSPTIVEPLGAWATWAQTFMFNKWCEEDIAAENILPCSISLNNLDSFKTSIPHNEEGKPINMTKDFIFSLHPYENQIRYGCLTPYQLKQYIKYFLDGGEKFNYDKKYAYFNNEGTEPVKFYYEDKGAQQEEETNIIKFGEKETVTSPKDGTTIRGVSTSCGSLQFHGLSFTVKQDGTRTYTPEGESEVKIYTLDESQPIKVYCPNVSTCKFDDPSTWVDITTMKYIPISMSSFCWQGGNAQNRMLNYWFKYNYEHETNDTLKKQIECRQLNPFYTTRLTAQEYARILTEQHKDLNEFLFPDGKPEFVKQQVIIPA